ncbi:hypothetical protein, partial [Bilophila wadsworthia]|uniref:hypothetical protein n=1 Tax=Bilophila wadsworthia TaxID=35833 RepID=UPI003AB52DB8
PKFLVLGCGLLVVVQALTNMAVGSYAGTELFYGKVGSGNAFEVSNAPISNSALTLNHSASNR